MVTTKIDYIRYLNRSYCIISHLAERLEELRWPNLFTDSPALIDTAIKRLEQQLVQADQIFRALGIAFSFEESEPLILFMEHLYAQVRNSNGHFSLFSLLDYVTVADALIKESAGLAELSLVNLTNVTVPAYYLYDLQTLEPIRKALTEMKVSA